MNKVGMGAACAAATYIGLGYLYKGADFAAVGPVEIDAGVMQAILSVLSFFVPAILSVVTSKFPALGEILSKIWAAFSNQTPAPVAASPLTDLLDDVNRISTVLAMRGDAAGVKCVCHLHDHLLNQTTVENTPEKPDATE